MFDKVSERVNSACAHLIFASKTCFVNKLTHVINPFFFQWVSPVFLKYPNTFLAIFSYSNPNKSGYSFITFNLLMLK